MNLFQSLPGGKNSEDASHPLADRMRPRTLEEYVGQETSGRPG